LWKLNRNSVGSPHDHNADALARVSRVVRQTLERLEKRTGIEPDLYDRFPFNVRELQCVADHVDEHLPDQRRLGESGVVGVASGSGEDAGVSRSKLNIEVTKLEKSGVLRLGYGKQLNTRDFSHTSDDNLASLLTCCIWR
jgi:hypothetical protein